MNKTRTAVAIIGGGRGCFELLTMIQTDRERLGLEVVGVADPDSSAPGIILAKQLGIPLVVDDYHEFFVRSDIKLVIELTGIQKVRDEVLANLPPHIHIIDYYSSRFLWDLFALAAEREEIERRSQQQLSLKDAQLDDTERTLRGILENSRDIIFMTDLSGILLTFNRGAEQALGYRREAVIGTAARQLAADPEAFDALLASAIRDGNATEYETEFIGEAGEQVMVNIGLTTTHKQARGSAKVVAICRDITNRLKLRQEVSDARQLAAIGKMAAGVAHEINNPLAVIDTISGLVADTLEEEKDALPAATYDTLAEAIQRLRLQVKRGTSITHSLLGFVRQTVSGSQVVNLERLIEESLDLLMPEISAAGVEIRRNYTAGPLQPRTDANLVQQVLVNLIKNALDAIEEKKTSHGALEIGTAPAEGAVEIYVEDNGTGIPEEARAEIFELFHTSKPAGKGTGLGLTIVQDIMVRIDGSIRCESEVGQWTRFTLTLPAVARPD